MCEVTRQTMWNKDCIVLRNLDTVYVKIFRPYCGPVNTISPFFPIQPKINIFSMVIKFRGNKLQTTNKWKSYLHTILIRKIDNLIMKVIIGNKGWNELIQCVYCLVHRPSNNIFGHQVGESVRMCVCFFFIVGHSH